MGSREEELGDMIPMSNYYYCKNHLKIKHLKAAV